MAFKSSNKVIQDENRKQEVVLLPLECGRHGDSPQDNRESPIKPNKERKLIINQYVVNFSRLYVNHFHAMSMDLVSMKRRLTIGTYSLFPAFC